MLPVPTFMVVALPKPFATRQDVFAMGQGCSIEDVLLEVAHRANLSPARLAQAITILDDVRIPKERWSTVRPHSGQQLLIKLVPGDPISIVSLVTAVAAFSAPGALGLAAGSFAAIAVSAGISLVGALISMAIAPAPRQSSTAPDRKEAAVQSIQGVSNQARPYGTVPKILGKVVNYYPPLAVAPYTEITAGNHQYLRMVFCVEGPVRWTNIKIGTTPLENFEGVTYETREGWSTDAPLTLFPTQVREQSLNIELRQVNSYSERRTEPDTDEVSLDVIFPGGLQRIGNRNQKFNLEVEFEVKVRAVGASSWSAATLTTDNKNITMSGAGRFTVRGNTKVSLRRSVRVELPARGRYDVAIRRLTTDDQSDTVGKDQSITIEQSFWTAMRSHRNAHPVNATGKAFLAIRIRASDQLNGVVDQVNVTLQSYLPVWDGVTWTDTLSRSPAWAFCEVLRGSSNARPLADSRIDLDKMIEWADFCATNGFTFDAALEDRTDVFSICQDIAGTAYASFSQSRGPISVIIDNERDVPIQHFTPRNSWNFASTKIFARRPHALKVRFPNELTLRQWDEIYVYEDGYSVANATLFETLELPYTSTARQARLRARHALVAARMRPEIYSLEVDVEHLVCTRGDLVNVTHDVPLWGVGSARVLNLVTAGADTTGVILDAPLPMELGVSYSFRFRLADGDSLVVPVDTVAGETDTFTFTTPVATADGPAVDDLAQFGVYGSESAQLIVRSVEPMNDLRARLTFVDYAPEVFTSLFGDLPDFDPQITLPPVVNRGIPAALGVTSIDSSEAVLVRASDGTLTSRIVIGFVARENAYGVGGELVQVRFRPADTDQDFEYLPMVPPTAGSFSVAPVDDGVTYEIELRAFFAGVPSEWTVIEHTVVGKTSPPPDVDQLYRQGDLIMWPYPDPPVDHAGFIVRANYGTSTDWSTGRDLHAGIITGNTFSIADQHGPQVFMVKAVDTSAIQAANAATLTVDLGDLYVENVIDTQSEAPSFAGTISGGTVTAGVLQADISASTSFYRTPGGRMYPPAGAPMYPTTTYEEMTYVASFTPAADQVGDATLKLDLTVTGDYFVEFRIATTPSFYPTAGSPMYTSGAPIYGATVVGEWAPWPGQLGPFENTANTYQIRVTVAGGTTRGEISQFDLVVDVPDIEELYEDVQITVAASGVRLTPAAARRAIDVVNLTLQDDGGSAVTLKIIDKNPTSGALVKAYTAAGSTTTATFDARTKAH